MKRIISLVLSLTLAMSLVACGDASGSNPEVITDSTVESSAPTDQVTTEEVEKEDVSEENLIEDEGWDQLEALGNVETENGIFTVKLTLPAEYAGEDVTQEKLDSEAGEYYLSAKLNEDGSVTYKMTKKQHKAMVEELQKSFDEGIQEMVDSEDYSFTEIEYNSDYTQFDAKLSGSEMGLGDTFAVYVFYMYAAIYGIYSGTTPENVVVNYYDADGNLIDSLNSADM